MEAVTDTWQLPEITFGLTMEKCQQIVGFANAGGR